ncbi:MAG: glycosyltransferase [Candidatus Magasanikbacteria bacterium]|nr:glycosyltransferase [Candidatus Magasanikbacteria bacterium]
MNLMQINTTDKRGGAAQIAWDIKRDFDARGEGNSFFVADRLSTESGIYEIKRSRLRKVLSIFFGRDFYNTDWLLQTGPLKKADVVHCHNLHGRYFNLNDLEQISRTKPVVWSLHDEWAITPHCVYTWQSNTVKDGFFVCNDKKMPERFLFNCDDFIAKWKRNIYNSIKINFVVPSLWLKKRVERSCLNKQKIHLIYNGIDIDHFKSMEKVKARKRLGLPLDKKIVLCLSDGGKDSPRWKGWEYARKIIDQYKTNSSVLFLCVGNKEQLPDETNLRNFGLISQSDLPVFYSASDVYLHTSLADNFPLVVLEAMSCGLPIVSFDVGGVREAAVHLENGFIAKYADEEDLVRGINHILGLNASDLENISKNSTERVRNTFSLDRMLNSYRDLYKSLL